MNRQWEVSQGRQSVELVHQETHDLECSFAVGMGRRNSRDGGYVYLEPYPDINAPLLPDMTNSVYVPTRLQFYRSEEISPALMKALLRTAMTTSAGEIVSNGGKIYLQLTVPEGTELSTLGMLRATLPLSTFHYAAPDLIDLSLIHTSGLIIAEYQLHTYTIFPINTIFGIPPLQGFYSLLDSPWGRGAIYGLQVLFTPCRADWYAFYLDLSRWVALPATGIISPHLPGPNEIIAKVTADGMFAVTIRLFSDNPRVLDVLGQNFIGSFNTPMQRLVYNGRTVGLDELTQRKTRREGVLLNADELAAIAAFPDASVRSSAFSRAPIPSTRIPTDFTPE
jgi:hypothetical protein